MHLPKPVVTTEKATLNSNTRSLFPGGGARDVVAAGARPRIREPETDPLMDSLMWELEVSGVPRAVSPSAAGALHMIV